MNKLLVAVFDNEAAALVGLHALRSLHSAGDITLYAAGVIARDALGHVVVSKPLDSPPLGTIAGLAVGSLVGLLGGPVGVAIGALTGTAAGAVRDFWVAGVGLDFIDEVTQQLQPGRVALVAEIEEEWVIPVDAALEGAGGRVMRRTRSEVAEAQFDHDIGAVRSEIQALESEAAHASGATKATLQTKLAAARTSLDGAVQRANERALALKHEADDKASTLGLQLGQVEEGVKSRLEARMKRVQHAYHARGAKLSQAWSLTKEALAV